MKLCNLNRERAADPAHLKFSSTSERINANTIVNWNRILLYLPLFLSANPKWYYDKNTITDGSMQRTEKLFIVDGLYWIR